MMMLHAEMKFIPFAWSAAEVNAAWSAASCMRSRKTIASPTPIRYQRAPMRNEAMKRPVTMTAPL